MTQALVRVLAPLLRRISRDGSRVRIATEAVMKLRQRRAHEHRLTQREQHELSKRRRDQDVDWFFAQFTS